MAVIALGKLGGRELNYSSDIDLVFAYEGEGETIETARPVDFGTYFATLASEFTTASWMEPRLPTTGRAIKSASAPDWIFPIFWTCR